MTFSQQDGGPSTPRVIRPYPFTVKPRPAPTSSSPEEVADGLRRTFAVAGSKAEVWARDEQEFQDSTVIFNGAVKTQALVLVRPKSAVDVSKTVIFCRQHGLELSVKAGGTGVHGWSVAGHVILDLCLLNQISVSLPDNAPTLHESFEALRLSDPPKRPSLHESGSSSPTIAKRTLSDLDGDTLINDFESSRGKRRIDLDDIVEHASRPDSAASSSKDDADMSSGGSRSSSGASRSGSADGLSNDTPPTSFHGSDKVGGREAAGGSSSSSGSSASASMSASASFAAPQARTTYVNPSPTTTAAFTYSPLNMASFNSATMAATPFGPSFSDLVLNTNPNPPPYTLVTFGGGVHSKQLDAATAASKYGAYHVPTSAFPVGSGQFLSGGFGFIGRKYGLAMDNVVEAEMVLADGRIVWVGEGGKHAGEWRDDDDPDEVWWGFRGAGAALGIVTRFRAKAYYLPSVFAGNLIYLFERSTTPSLLRHVRDCIKGAPRGLYANIIMTAGPPNAPAIVVIQLCFSGSRSEGEMYIQAIAAWVGGRTLFQDFSERKFERQQVAVEEILKDGKGRKWYIKSDMLKSLSDEVIDKTCARFHAVPDGCTWLFEYTGGGAVGDIKDSVFPSSHREAAFTVAALHQWGHGETPIQDTRCVITAEDWINEVIHPNSPGGPLPCFLQICDEESVAAVYGDNYGRLKALKQKIDPTNLFRHAAWPPACAMVAGKEQMKQQSIQIDGDMPQGHTEGLPDGEADPTPGPNSHMNGKRREVTDMYGENVTGTGAPGRTASQDSTRSTPKTAAGAVVGALRRDANLSEAKGLLDAMNDQAKGTGGAMDVDVDGLASMAQLARERGAEAPDLKGVVERGMALNPVGESGGHLV